MRNIDFLGVLSIAFLFFDSSVASSAEPNLAFRPSPPLAECIFTKLQSEGLKDSAGSILSFANCRDQNIRCETEPFFGLRCFWQKESDAFFTCGFKAKVQNGKEAVDPQADLGNGKKGPGRKGYLYCSGKEPWVLTREPGGLFRYESFNEYAERIKPSLGPLDQDALRKMLFRCWENPAAKASLAAKLESAFTPSSLHDLVKQSFPEEKKENVIDFVVRTAGYTPFADGMIRYCKSLE